MGRYVDLHAHFLPGLDDGAKDLASALQMVNAVAALGFEQLHATPHQRAGMFLPDATQIGDAFALVREAVARAHPQVSLGLAAENYWDEVFHERLFAGPGRLPSYGEGKSFLFEVSPRMLPPRLEGTLFDIRVSGRLPVMAHPERYREVQEDLGRAETIGRSAALVVDLGALDGAHGRMEMKTARRLLEEGLAHAAATDIHAPEDQRVVAAGMAWIRKRLGEETLEQLLAENPRRIVQGELP